MQKYHVLPINDSKKHQEKGVVCDCKPEIKLQVDDDGECYAWLIVHNAWDGREWKELADGTNY